MKYFIGWDVGAWKCEAKNKASCDALFILNDKQMMGHHRGNISGINQQICDVPHAEKIARLIESFLSRCSLEERFSSDDEYFLAIDTPLGWPHTFSLLMNRTLSEKWNYHEDRRNIDNTLLFRKTERELGSSLSAVVDSIGSQSTKGIALLCSLNAALASWGIWRAGNLTIIETYPKACIRSEVFLEWAVKQSLTHDNREWYFYKNRKSDRRIQEQDDTFDAGICALLAMAFADHSFPLKQPPATDPNQEVHEGWIFYPEGQLIAKSALEKYGKVVNATDVDTFGTALQRLRGFIRQKHESGDAETQETETDE
jgi:hypothetical protein